MKSRLRNRTKRKETQKGAHGAACARKRENEDKRMTTYTLTHTMAYRRRWRTNKF